MSNLQDFFQQSDGTDGGQLFKGNAITIGTSAGAKSIVFSNDVGEVDLVINPSAGTMSVNLPTSSGTILVSGQAIQGLGVSTGGNTAGSTGTTVGTMVLAGGNNVTLSQSTAAGSLATITISAANSATVVSGVGVSTGGNTAGTTGTTNGTIVLAGGNNVTLSQSTAANAATITVSTPNMFAGGVSTGGNTAGSTGTVSSQVVFAGGNNVTLSQSTGGASNATITISAANSGTVVSGIGVSTGGNTLGDTGTTVGTVVFAGIGNISLSQSTAAGSLATITISGAAAAGTGVAGIGVSTGGNTAGNTGTTQGTYVLAGGNNITLSQSTAGGSLATVTISAPNAVLGAGVSTGGNTAGTTGTTFGTIVLAGGNNITLSQSTAAGSLASITISGMDVVEGFGISNIGNTSGTSGTQTGTIVLAGGNQVTLSQSTGAGGVHTITISINEPSLKSFTFPDQPAGSFASSDAAFSLMPFQIGYNVSATKLMFLAQLTAAQNSTGSVTFSAGLYTMSGSTASLASSTSRAFSWSSGSTNTTATSVYGGHSGTRYRTMALGTWNITPGNYLFGFYGRSSNAGTWSFYGQTQTLSLVGPVETNETQFFLPGHLTSSFTTAMPASINVTDTNYVRTGASAYRQIGFLFQAS